MYIDHEIYYLGDSVRNYNIEHVKYYIKTLKQLRTKDNTIINNISLFKSS